MPDRRRAIEREHLRAALVPRDEPLKLSLARAIASRDISNRVRLPVERRGLLPRLRLLGAEEARDPESLADGGLRALADERAVYSAGTNSSKRTRVAPVRGSGGVLLSEEPKESEGADGGASPRDDGRDLNSTCV